MNRAVLGRVLVGVGVAGALATLVGTIIGVVLLGAVDRSLRDSVVVTADALEALQAAVEVADVLVDDVSSTLFDAALASRAAAGGADAAVEVLDGAADVTGDQVAGSLAAVEDSLPALIDVAGVIDSTLSALDRLPIGPTYDPDVAFDDALRGVEAELDGLPEALRAQAVLLRDGAVELGDVGRSAAFVADDLEELARSLRDAGDVLGEVRSTATDASGVLEESTAGLTGGTATLRVLSAVSGAALTVGQLVLAAVGWWLLDPERFVPLLGAPPADD